MVAIPSLSLIFLTFLFSIFDDANCQGVDTIKLRFYTGSVSSFVEINLSLSEQLLSNSQFKINASTVFYIHGYTENPLTESVVTVVTAYQEAHPEINIILVDWSLMANQLYPIAAANTVPVSSALAIQLNKLINSGLPKENIHLVGHSLGAHVAGFTGQKMITYTKKLIRITGLDPANPLFYPGIWGKISYAHANLVDIIHTDAGVLGAPVPTGSLDFWPNGGHAIQPGCPTNPSSPSDIKCNHSRSWRFWAESVRNSTAFIGVNFFGTITTMGFAASPSSFGSYFLITKSQSPFGLGTSGARMP